MKFTKHNWKQNLRTDLFGWLPPPIYLKIVPIYFKIFNSKRRGCNYKFSVGKNSKNILHDGSYKFYFADHRRLNRYMYKNGLSRIKKLMLNKYCNGKCKIDKNDVVVEIGANIGEFTLVAAEMAKKVYAFEPDPKCIDCLILNVQSINNVSIIEYGLSDKNKNKVFYLSTEEADSSFIKPKTYTSTIEIKAIRLDTWMQEVGLEKIDFLKLEAEGAELEVLIGLGEKITCVKKITVDGGPERRGKTTFNEVANYLTQRKFQVNVDGNHVFAWR